MAIINTIIHCGCPFSLQIFTMDHTHDCVDDNPETMNEHDESDHSGTTHYPEFQRHYVSTRTGIRPRPGQNQTRIYPQTYQAWKCNIIWKCINTQFGYMCEPLKLWLDTFKYISISPSPHPFPLTDTGGRVRLYSESQVCSQVGRRDNTEFQDVMTPTEECGGDGAPFRSRSQSAPPTLWAAKKYGRQLRRMSDEFDTWLDKGVRYEVRQRSVQLKEWGQSRH